jgi:FkbM family methyltransferase
MKKLLMPLNAVFHRLKNRLQSDPSENGETQVLKSILQPNSSRFLVDVGANDGRLYSNSFSLVQEGWGGILIEPLPSPFKILNKRYAHRSDVKCVNQAISLKKGAGAMFIGTDGSLGMTSTLCTDKNDWFDRARTQQQIQVEVSPLTEILDFYQAPTEIGILMIDTEGLDFEVLQSLDFNKYHPEIILTEDYPYDLPKLEKKELFLRGLGYGLHHKFKGNSIWKK